VTFKVDVTYQPNEPPVAEAGPDVEAEAGSPISFDASASTDPDGSISRYHWDFGDGNQSTGITTRHIYQFPGTYEVRLTVTDDGREEGRYTAFDTLKVAVAPRPNKSPVAAAGEDRTVKLKEIVRFDGSASHDPDGNIMAFRWDFGDGGKSPDEQPMHTFHDPGVYDVKLVVTDDAEEPAMAETAIKVTVVDDKDGGTSE
jgi:PKD repeat protein